MKKGKIKSFIVTALLFAILIVILSIIFAQEKEDDISYLNNNYEPYFVLSANGDQARRMGNFDIAFSYYQKSISINPKNPYPYMWMAFMYNQEKLIIPAINEIENAKKHKNYFEFYFVSGDKNNTDLYNLHMLESYIYFNKNEINKAIEILLKDVLLYENSNHNINNQSILFNDINFTNLDKKYFPIFGDTYIILLYLKYINNELDVIEDIERNSNIQTLLDKDYKSNLIAYIFLKKLDENESQDYKRYERKYESILKEKKNKSQKYEELIQNPYILHDFDSY